MDVKETLLVGIGGFIGAVGRYHLGGMVMHRFGAPDFPVGTFAVNLLGCFVIGILLGFAERSHAVSPEYRLLLVTGLLGGFTTFSAFGYESVFLLRKGLLLLSMLYVGGSVVLGLALAAVGVWISRVWLSY